MQRFLLLKKASCWKMLIWCSMRRLRSLCSLFFMWSVICSRLYRSSVFFSFFHALSAVSPFWLLWWGRTPMLLQLVLNEVSDPRSPYAWFFSISGQNACCCVLQSITTCQPIIELTCCPDKRFDEEYVTRCKPITVLMIKIVVWGCKRENLDRRIEGFNNRCVQRQHLECYLLCFGSAWMKKPQPGYLRPCPHIKWQRPHTACNLFALFSTVVYHKLHHSGRCMLVPLI